MREDKGVGCEGRTRMWGVREGKGVGCEGRTRLWV